MNNLTRPLWMRAGLSRLGSAATLCALVGCQSYERAPLDLAEHRSAFSSRLENTEAIERFAERLAEADEAVVEHFDPTDGLTQAEGEVLALFYNADLRIARLDAGVSSADRNLPNTKVGFLAPTDHDRTIEVVGPTQVVAGEDEETRHG